MNKRPRILFFSLAYSPFAGGAEHAVEEITKRLGDFEFHCITYRFDSRWPREEVIGNVTVFRVGWGRSGGSYYGRIVEKFLFIPLAFCKALQLQYKNRYSVFWSIMASRASAPALFLKLLYPRIPFLLTIQEGDTKEYAYRRLGILRYLWRFVFKKADHIQVISSYLKSFCIEEGALPERISIIPNGVDVEVFSKNYAQSEKDALRKKIGIGAHEKVILTISRLVPKNGVDILIEATAQLRAKGIAVKTVLIGSGPDEDMLRSKSRDLKIEDGVRFLGDIPNAGLPRYLAISDVFVRPSRSEGLGTAFLEAMAAGIPIIGTPVGGIPDFLEDGTTGLFMKTDDPDDCAQKIKRLLTDDVLCETIKKHSLESIEKRYTWDRIAGKFLVLFQKMQSIAVQKRILLVSGIFPPDVGGSATYALNCMNELPRNGFAVECLTYGEKEQNDGEKNIIRSSRKVPKGIRHVLFFFRCLRRAWISDKVFSVDASIGGGLPAFCAAKILGKRFSVRVTGEYAWEQGQARFGVSDSLEEFQDKKYGFFVECLRFFEHWMVRNADAIIAPSKYLKKIIAGWEVSEKKITVIYNVQSSEINYASYRALSRDEARKRLHIPYNGKIVLSAGRLVPWKGFSELLDCMPGIRDVYPDVVLYIAGDGPDEEKLKAKAVQLKLEASVFFIGRIPHERLALYLRAGDVFVLNSRYEGFSHQLVEALALGIPVITTDVGGNREIIRDQENGIFVPWGDTAALTKEISELLRDSRKKDLLVRGGYATEERFAGISKMMRELTKIL